MDMALWCETMLSTGTNLPFTFTFNTYLYNELLLTILRFSYGCKKWFLTLREEYKFQVSGNKIRKMFGPTRDKVTEQFRILHNEELCGLYRSASIVGAGAAQSI
jgi:hypothetical protein